MINLKLEYNDCIRISIFLRNHITELEEDIKRNKNNEGYKRLLKTFIKQAKKIDNKIQSQINEQLYKDKHE